MTDTGRHAFLILAHEEPEQLAMLLHLLDAPGNDVHLQASSAGIVDPARYRLARAELSVLDPFPVHWGGFSQIEATLRLLDSAVAGGHHDWYHMLTGTDLPLVSQPEIRGRLSGRSTQFLSLDPGLRDSAQWRMSYRHYLVERPDFRDRRAVRQASRAAVRVQRALRMRRRPPQGVVWTAGSAYFTITHPAAESILGYRRWIEAACRRSIAGDEVVVNTILTHSDFRHSISSQGPQGEGNLRHVDWQRGAGDSPHIFTIDDLAELREASRTKLFARKFKRSVDPRIVDHIATALAAGDGI